MKRFLYTLLLPILLVGCKKDDMEIPPAIKELVGKWQLQAVEKTVNGQTFWEEVPAADVSTFTIRFDGVLLGSDGLPPCCGLDRYSVNAVTYVVKPQMKVPYNAECELLNCASCPRNMTIENDELIVTSTCEKSISRAKYKKQ
jgi:hypothetical protein